MVEYQINLSLSDAKTGAKISKNAILNYMKLCPERVGGVHGISDDPLLTEIHEICD